MRPLRGAFRRAEQGSPHPARTTPFLIFIVIICGVASALIGRDFEDGGARQIPDALAEMPEAQMQNSRQN